MDSNINSAFLKLFFLSFYYCTLISRLLFLPIHSDLLYTQHCLFVFLKKDEKQNKIILANNTPSPSQTQKLNIIYWQYYQSDQARHQATPKWFSLNNGHWYSYEEKKTVSFFPDHILKKKTKKHEAHFTFVTQSDSHNRLTCRSTCRKRDLLPL